jgi:hypothetical protein
MASRSRIEQIPTKPAATTSSGGRLRIPSLGPRPSTSGIIQRVAAISGPGRRPPWTPERGRVLLTTSAARRRRRAAPTWQNADTKDEPYTTVCITAHLPLTLAGRAAGGEGEGRRRVNAASQKRVR